MPTVQEKDIQGYAHCNDPRCPGANQERVAAKSVETSFTYRELGANAPGFERSTVQVVFADPDEQKCKHCERTRSVTDQPRVVYDNHSKHDPMGLLNIPAFNPAKQAEVRSSPTDEHLASMEAEIEALREQLKEKAA
jgi:hypothetical protein